MYPKIKELTTLTVKIKLTLMFHLRRFRLTRPIINLSVKMFLATSPVTYATSPLRAGEKGAKFATQLRADCREDSRPRSSAA